MFRSFIYIFPVVLSLILDIFWVLFAMCSTMYMGRKQARKLTTAAIQLLNDKVKNSEKKNLRCISVVA